MREAAAWWWRGLSLPDGLWRGARAVAVAAWRVSPPLTASLAVTSLATAAFPMIQMIAVSVVVGGLPEAARDGSGSAAARPVYIGLGAMAVTYLTQLGTEWPGGVDLSLGQWQRLALARSMMRTSPSLLVLDEPSASLDTAAEHALYERFSRASDFGSATSAITLLVSHRFSTVRMADLIVLLRDGRVREIGSHDELMRLGGVYAELFEMQARGYR